jgi:predicted MFS family arabinose efflux permease
MPASLWWLCLGAFAIGTEGFMIAGLLPVLAADKARIKVEAVDNVFFDV